MTDLVPTITLFEHQRRAYADLGWTPNDPAMEALEEINEAAGTELICLGRTALQATQFVGAIRAGETMFQILPKIDFDPIGDAEAVTGSIPYQVAVDSATRNLLYLLSYTHDFPIREQDVSPLLDQRCDWFEILTRLLALNLHREMMAGPERAYTVEEETLPAMRGRWQLDRQLTRHPHVRHRFDVAYDEFTPNTSLNQVFCFTAGRLLLRTRDQNNRHLLNDIRRWLANVEEPAAISCAHLDRVCFSRLNERFRPSFQLARLFVENEVLQLAAGRHHTFAFVLDMNRLFEAFVAGFLARHKEQILPEGWKDIQLRPQAQGQAIYLADRLPTRRGVFRLKPDILFTRPSGRAVLVLDTKYKHLDRHRRQLGASREDVYQMLAYAVALDCPRALLLYPQPVDRLPGMVAFEMRGYPSRVTVAAVNLRERLDRPQPLIEALNTLLQEVTHYDPQRKA